MVNATLGAAQRATSVVSPASAGGRQGDVTYAVRTAANALLASNATHNVSLVRNFQAAYNVANAHGAGYKPTTVAVDGYYGPCTLEAMQAIVNFAAPPRLYAGTCVNGQYVPGSPQPMVSPVPKTPINLPVRTRGPVLFGSKTLGAAAATPSTIASEAVATGISGGLLGLLVGAITRRDLGTSAMWGAGIGVGIGALLAATSSS
jgi:hypothetical protein